MSHWDYVGLAVLAGCLTIGLLAVSCAFGGYALYFYYEEKVDAAIFAGKMTFAMATAGTLFMLLTTSIIFMGR